MLLQVKQVGGEGGRIEVSERSTSNGKILSQGLQSSTTASYSYWWTVRTESTVESSRSQENGESMGSELKWFQILNGYYYKLHDLKVSQGSGVLVSNSVQSRKHIPCGIGEIR